MFLRLAIATAALLFAGIVSAGDVPTGSPSAQRGYQVLRNRPFLPPDFDDGVFEKLWTVWPAERKAEAEAATPARRRELTFARYGLQEPPDAPADYDGPAIGYVDDGNDGWVMNCFACHAGQVAGRVLPGAPNTDIDLQSLVEDVRKLKLAQFKAFTHLDLGSLKVPLGGSRGTTNSVVFGILLDGLRRPDMSVDLSRKPGTLLHHDMDAPAWWNVSKKSKLYVDGFAPKNHRILMQFMLIPRNDRDTIYSWEEDFRDVLAYIESIEPPKYPWEIDEPLAVTGKIAFEANCSSCHGTYGANERYPEKIIPIEELGTDPVRLQALSVEHRAHLQQTWMTHYGRDETIVDPGGYVAPPLDGVWASAPYFHNGSVPTLWHVLHPGARPKLWKRDRTADGYDYARIGLAVEELKALPKSFPDLSAQREIFATSLYGKSAAGHEYPDALSEEEKRAVLEYLKTL
jgi:mono/diheme cytochrome c family protein